MADDGWIDMASVGNRKDGVDVVGTTECNKNGADIPVAISVIDALGLPDRMLNIEGDNV